MTNQHRQKQLWIGLVEVRAGDKGSPILGDTKGAFANILTWASNVEEYERNARLVIGELGGTYVSEIIDPEPLEQRKAKRGGHLDEEIEEMASRAEGNPDAIIYGTFHTYERDDA
jgi:hypothetical protein